MVNISYMLFYLYVDVLLFKLLNVSYWAYLTFSES